MTDLKLRPMTDDEQRQYAERVENGQAPQLAAPGGQLADGQHLFAGEVDGDVVGYLWLAEQAPDGRAGQAWIYDVEVDPTYRGKGFGRTLVLAAQDKARQLGCTSVGLNVVGGNDVAIRLYESLGFRTRAMQMSKPL